MGEPATGVLHGDGECVGVVLEGDGGAGRPGVAYDVGGRLLDDAQRGSSTAAGSGRTSPCSVLRTVSPACALRSTRSSRDASLPLGVRGALSPASRRTPTSDRSSTSASLLASLMAVSAVCACSGWRSTMCSATPACTLISEMWCATTSCSSRAICSRSSLARRRPSSSFACRAARVRSRRIRISSPTARTSSAQARTPENHPHDHGWSRNAGSTATKLPSSTVPRPSHAATRWPSTTVETVAIARLANTGP